MAAVFGMKPDVLYRQMSRWGIKASDFRPPVGGNSEKVNREPAPAEAATAGMSARARWAAVTEEELRGHLADGKTVKDVAGVYGVDPATVNKKMRHFGFSVKDVRPLILGRGGQAMKQRNAAIRAGKKVPPPKRPRAPKKEVEIPAPDKRKRLRAEIHGMSLPQVANHFGISMDRARALVWSLHGQ
ncbi:hypothetical protein [Kitasatospora sp. NPDC056800]|uniref:hypothetical protein n=1 Tax=Kitasatospora sp. NPDC056800 TaxID=3345948 RepID=UPI0036809FF3